MRTRQPPPPVKRVPAILAAAACCGVALTGAGCRHGWFGQQTVEPPGLALETQRAETSGQAYAVPVNKRPLPDLTITAPLPAALEYAFTANGDLEAAYREWRAALARVPQAGALNDPRLDFGFLFAPGAFASFSSIVDNITVMLSREFPAPGKRDARAEQALAAARATGQRFVAVRYRIQTRVARAYSALALNEALQAQNTAALRLLRQSDEIVTHRFHGLGTMDSGAESLVDVQKIATEIKTVESEQRALQLRRRGLTAELNAALNRPTETPLGKIELPVVSAPAESAAELFARAVERNPDLATLREEIAAGKAGEVLARLAAKPDYTLGAGFEGGLTVKASMTLPVNRARIRAGIAEALAAREAGEARLRAAAADTQARVVMALTGLDDAQRILRDYSTDIVPATRKLLDAQLAAYGAGTGDLLEILDTERLLVDYQRLLLRARTDQFSSLAELDEVLGGGVLRP